MARKKKGKATTRRSRKRAIKKRVGKSITSNFKKISTGIGVLAFLSNITGSDMAASTGQPIAARAQNLVNSLLGRITGFTPFKNAPGANTPQTVSLDGVFNKYSGGGLASYIYGMLPIKALPHKGKAKTLGKTLLTAGIISGIFMPTSNPDSHNLISKTSAPVMSTPEVSYT